MRAPTNQPNIILVNCDDLGYGDLGCYGSSINQTPTLDRMAQEGVRCTDFYMASPVCSPSRGAMMTGCYPPRIGFATFSKRRWVLFPGDAMGLNPSEITIAKLLKDQGYATKMVGKWHCGDQLEFLPTRHGFDSYFGLPYSNDMGRQVGHTERPPLPLLRNEEVIQQQPDQSSLTERYVGECVSFIRENRDRPFFLYFAHMYVHLPIYAPKMFMDTSKNGAYGAAVACIDWSMKVLFHELEKLGLDQNTLVVFTSDNGARGDHGGSNGPLRGKKGTTWEGGQRVACLARWPGQIPKNTTCSELITAMDFFPTFAELAGAKVPSDRIIDGKNIFPVLQGKAKTPHQNFFYYFKDDLEAVRSGDWKLHVSKKEEPILELYDLKKDIGETVNLASQFPEVVDDLQKKAEKCREDLGDFRTNRVGQNCRPAGKVSDPKPLTVLDDQHPYICALYDLSDVG